MPTIKTIRHKKNSLRSLLKYLADGMSNPQRDLLLAHNVHLGSLKKIEAQYRENDRYRSNRAKVRWYHEVVSWHEADSKNLDHKKLLKLAQEYINQRNPNALCVVFLHSEKAHKHLHFLFSGTEYRSAKTLRMSDEVFKNLRVGYEEYQVENFPELVNSVVYLDDERAKNRQKSAEREDRNTRRERQYKAKKRSKRQLKKERIMAQVEQMYERSESLAGFYKELENEGLAVYAYRGRVAGVIAEGRKYRFSTLGISKERLAALELEPKRNVEIGQENERGR